jgi:hypothetical protein
MAEGVQDVQIAAYKEHLTWAIHAVGDGVKVQSAFCKGSKSGTQITEHLLTDFSSRARKE